jgi:hypothetical protein
MDFHNQNIKYHHIKDKIASNQNNFHSDHKIFLDSYQRTLKRIKKIFKNFFFIKNY